MYWEPDDHRLKRLKALGAFMKEQRQRKKLSRNDVAAVLGISEEYYKKFEQGKDRIAKDLLAALVDLYQLHEHERRHVFKLATGLLLPPSGVAKEEVPFSQQVVLDKLNPYPAFIAGRRYDTLAWNAASAVIYGDFAKREPEDRNTVVMLFTETWAREFVGDWPTHAQRLVCQFRSDYVQYFHDPLFTAIVEQLKAVSPEFMALWDAQAVAQMVELDKIFNHPHLGQLRFKQVVYNLIDVPGARMVIYVPVDRETTTKLHEFCSNR